MAEYKLGDVEMRFADLIWDNEPLTSGELVKFAEEALDWKKSTTYTILRRLCDRGIFQNNGGIVTSQISKKGFDAAQSEKFVEDTFSGSLTKFLLAFVSKRRLTTEELGELQIFIDEYKLFYKEREFAKN